MERGRRSVSSSLSPAPIGVGGRHVVESVGEAEVTLKAEVTAGAGPYFVAVTAFPADRDRRLTACALWAD